MEPASTRQCGACCTKVSNLSVRIGRSLVLDRVSLHMHCGQLTTLIGPNGAGKTTFLRALLGEVRYEGEIQFMRIPGAPEVIVPRIGYVPQKIAIDHASPLTVNDLFASVISRRPVWLGCGRSTLEATRGSLALTEAADLGRLRIGALSTGQLQRVLLALALTPVPNILLLDEPTAGVDAAGMEIFYGLLSRFRHNFDLAILLVSHDLPVAAGVSDRMIFLNHTIVCDGSPAEVLGHPEVRRRFGHDYSPEAVAGGRAKPEGVSSAAHPREE